MRADYALDGGDGCIAEARHHAIVFLDRARTGHDVQVSQRAVDLTQLVVSELVTNALTHGSGPVLMELRLTNDRVDVVVRDSDPTLPAAWAADPGRIGLGTAWRSSRPSPRTCSSSRSRWASASRPASPCPTPPTRTSPATAPPSGAAGAGAFRWPSRRTRSHGDPAPESTRVPGRHGRRRPTDPAEARTASSRTAGGEAALDLPRQCAASPPTTGGYPEMIGLCVFPADGGTRPRQWTSTRAWTTTRMAERRPVALVPAVGVISMTRRMWWGRWDRDASRTASFDPAVSGVLIRSWPEGRGRGGVRRR